MDSLEQMIRKNREAIQNDLPPDGHFDRFELKLSQKSHKYSTYWIGFLSGMVAVIVIGVIMFLHPGKELKNSMTVSNLSGQNAEVEFYYTHTINQQTQKLNEYSIKFGANDPSLKMLIKELEEYDHTYSQICKDLQTTPNDERVINALITYYQTKLEIINKILQEVENKQVKQKENESTKI
jgi:hypothetical protein